MLAMHPIDVMLTATDLGVAKEFYGDRIGLELLMESDEFVTFGCGGDSRLVVTRSSTRSKWEQTRASWRVADVGSEVADLRTGSKLASTTSPASRQWGGVADVGFALSASFVDPEGNTIGLLQFKDKSRG